MSVIHPFDDSGITRGADGIARYQDRPPSVVEMLRRTVEAAPQSEAIVEVGGERINYRNLWDRAARVAGGLQAMGIERGDRAAIRLGNGLNWCLAFYGIELAGAIAVPVNTRFTETEVEYVINDSGSRFVCLPNEPLPDGPGLAVENLQSEDIAAIFYTSGTTGFPKGAITTHGNFLSNIENCRRVSRLPFDGSLRTLVSVPLFHVTGCNSQLLIRGPNVVKGYWNKPEATAETFVDGWLHTGDVARLDDEGFVQILDRKKDMVNRGGENVYCVEVENALAAHPAVFEVAVMGVFDEMMGEKVGAAIVLKPGVHAEISDIVEFAKSRLADFKIPQYLAFCSEVLPRNPGGKILKKVLRSKVDWGKPVW